MDTDKRLQHQLVAAMASHLKGDYTAAIPEAGRLVWQWFLELSDTRTWHQAGPNAISYSEIYAWMQVTRWPVQPRHIGLITALDSAWLAHFYAQRKREQENKDKPKLPQRSEHELTPELFDAMFG